MFVNFNTQFEQIYLPIVVFFFFYIITLFMPSALEIRMKDCTDSFMSSTLLDITTFSSSWTSLSAPLSNCVGDSLIQRGIKEKKKKSLPVLNSSAGLGHRMDGTTDSDRKATAFFGDLSDTLGV